MLSDTDCPIRESADSRAGDCTCICVEACTGAIPALPGVAAEQPVGVRGGLGRQGQIDQELVAVCRVAARLADAPEAVLYDLAGGVGVAGLGLAHGDLFQTAACVQHLDHRTGCAELVDPGLIDLAGGGFGVGWRNECGGFDSIPRSAES